MEKPAPVAEDPGEAAWGGGGGPAAAVRLSCGVDLPAALRQTGQARRQAIARLRRATERERLKGGAGYDLDRHAALCEALALLTDGTRGARNGSGARRRRR